MFLLLDFVKKSFTKFLELVILTLIFALLTLLFSPTSSSLLFLMTITKSVTEGSTSMVFSIEINGAAI